MNTQHNTTPEHETAKTILQDPIPFEIAGVTYQVPQPTAATLAMVSSEVSKLNLVSEPIEGGNENRAVGMVITDGSKMKEICRVLAIIILGAKRIRDNASNESTVFSRVYNRIKQFFKPEKSVVDNLAEEIMYEASAEQLNRLLSQAFTHLDLGFFFETTIFLKSLNLTKATKETIVSGPQFPDL